MTLNKKVEKALKQALKAVPHLSIKEVSSPSNKKMWMYFMSGYNNPAFTGPPNTPITVTEGANNSLIVNAKFRGGGLEFNHAIMFDSDGALDPNSSLKVSHSQKPVFSGVIGPLSIIGALVPSLGIAIAIANFSVGVLDNVINNESGRSINAENLVSTFIDEAIFDSIVTIMSMMNDESTSEGDIILVLKQADFFNKLTNHWQSWEKRSILGQNFGKYFEFESNSIDARMWFPGFFTNQDSWSLICKFDELLSGYDNHIVIYLEGDFNFNILSAKSTMLMQNEGTNVQYGMTATLTQEGEDISQKWIKDMQVEASSLDNPDNHDMLNLANAVYAKTTELIQHLSNNMCQLFPGVSFSSLDAAVYSPNKGSSGSYYLFKGHHYYKFDIATQKTKNSSSKHINQKHWDDLLFKKLDAAVYDPQSDVYYFFYENYFDKFDVKKNRSAYGKHAKKIQDNNYWPGLKFDSLDAAFVNPDEGHLGTFYFFKGSSYMTFDIQNWSTNQSSPISFNNSHFVNTGWDKLDSALYCGYGTKKAFLFKDGNYILWDLYSQSVIEGPTSFKDFPFHAEPLSNLTT